MEKKKFVSFCDEVEIEAMRLCDDFFVRLSSEMLNDISEYQTEMDADKYLEKWNSKIGEIVYLYVKREGESALSWASQFWDFSLINKESDSVTLVDKDTLTRSAARKLAQYFYNGKSHIDEIGDNCAMALMLTLRNGCHKKDFWDGFRFELIDALQELIAGKTDLDIEEVANEGLYKDGEFCITDIVKEAEADVANFKDHGFHLLDKELIDLLIEKDEFSKDFKDDYLNSEGKYALIYPVERDVYDGFRSIQELRDFNGELLSCTYLNAPAYAAMAVEDMFFSEDSDTEYIIKDCSTGLALYKHNSLSTSDFWRQFCIELVKELDHTMNREKYEAEKDSAYQSLVEDFKQFIDEMPEDQKQFWDRVKDKRYNELAFQELKGVMDIFKLILKKHPNAEAEKFANLI